MACYTNYGIIPQATLSHRFILGYPHINNIKVVSLRFLLIKYILLVLLFILSFIYLLFMACFYLQASNSL